MREVDGDYGQQTGSGSAAKLLQECEIRLVYQPVYSTSPEDESIRSIRGTLNGDASAATYSLKVVGMEALCRPEHPSRGVLNPAALLPEIEKFPHQARELDERVLAAVRRDSGKVAPMLENRDLGERAARGEAFLSINTTPSSLAFKETREEAKSAAHLLKGYGIGVVLEVTERQGFVAEEVAEGLRDIRESGIAVAADDLGSFEAERVATGSNEWVGERNPGPGIYPESLGSLGRLAALGIGKAPRSSLIGTEDGEIEERRMPAAKLDRKFMASILEGEQRALDTLSDIQEACDYPVVAEGIEHPESVERIRGLGIEMAQGFGLSKPLPLGQYPATNA